MKPRRNLENEEIIIFLLKNLGGMASTIKIKQELRNDNIDVRKTLRQMEHAGRVKSDRPFTDKLDLRWELLKQYPDIGEI